MKVLGGLFFVLATIVGSGFSLTCYTHSGDTGEVESECEVDDPALQTATSIDTIERLCYTFQSIELQGKNRKVTITRGCSSDNKLDTCEKLKETLLIGKQAKTALTNCTACYSNFCNYDPNWTEHDSPSSRQERQWGKNRPTTRAGLVPPAAPKPVATTARVEEETQEPERSDESNKEQGAGEEIGARQGPWGQGKTTRNPYGTKDNSGEQGEGRGEYGAFGSGINGQPRPGPGWTNNGQQGGINGQAKPGPGSNYGQGVNGQNGNGFGSGINGQPRPGPGWTNNGQQGGINGQAKPGPGSNYGQGVNGQNGNGFGSGINGQPRPGPGWTNNGQQGGINGQAKPGPGYGQGNSFGEQTENPFEGENVGPDGTKVGQNPDGSWKTGVQYVTKYPGENKKVTSPYQPGAKPFPTHSPGSTNYYTKDKSGPPAQSSSGCVHYGAIFVLSSVLVLFSI